MAKLALLIGVSEYEPGLNPLPAAEKDVEAMRRLLQHPEIGEFNEVRTLLNADPLVMQETIETLFSGRTKEDLLLLFFSGHGVKDDSGRLYFATRITRKNPKGELVKATAVPASFVHDVMSNSRSRRQVMILDCCFSGAFAEGLLAKDDGSVNIKTQLGGEGRVVLTSSTSTQYSFEQQDSELSIYTRYLVEGIETGVADRNNDGMLSTDELHEYAKKKVQETAPAMKPEIYAVKEGYKILLAKAPIGDPKLKYRKEVEQVASRGEISIVGRQILDEVRDKLGLLAEETAAIEAEALKPIIEYRQNLMRYEQALVEAIQHENFLSEDTQNELQRYQEILGLTDEDVAPIKARILPQEKDHSEDDKKLLQAQLIPNSQDISPVEPLPERNFSISAAIRLLGDVRLPIKVQQLTKGSIVVALGVGLGLYYSSKSQHSNIQQPESTVQESQVSQPPNPELHIQEPQASPLPKSKPVEVSTPNCGWNKPFSLACVSLSNSIPISSEEDNKDHVFALMFSFDGKKIITSSLGVFNPIKIWDVNTKQMLITLPESPTVGKSIAISPDSQIIAANTDESQENSDTGIESKVIRLWNLGKPEQPRNILIEPLDKDRNSNPGSGAQWSSLAISPDGQTLAFGSGDGTEVADNAIRFWNLKTGKLMRVWPDPDGVQSLAFHPNKQTLISSSISINGAKSSTKVWNLSTGKVIYTFSGEFIGISSDGQRLIVRTGYNYDKFTVWELKTGKELRTVTLDSSNVYVNDVAVSPDGRTLVRANRRGVDIWSLETGNFLGFIEGKNKSDSFYRVAINPDGKSFVTFNETTSTLDFWQ